MRLWLLAPMLMCSVSSLATPPNYLDRQIEHEGLRVRVRIDAMEEQAPAEALMGQTVRLTLRGARAADDHPLNHWSLGAWLDSEIDAMSGAVPLCGQRIGRFLSGNLMNRPMLDLTGYYVLSLDSENSVSVLDPAVNFSGRSSLYKSIKLQGQGFDWVKSADDARLYVALRDQKKIAAIDLQTLSLIDHIPLRGYPTRTVMQADDRLLWIGETGENAAESGVTAIDVLDGKKIARLPLPPGHHEFAFSRDGRFVFISSRQAGTVTQIDAAALKNIREMKIDGEPIALAFTPGNDLLWVVEPKNGYLLRYDTQGNAVDRIKLDRGLGPARVTPDGRFVLVANPLQHRVYVLDARTGKETQRATVSGQPYDIVFTPQFAYVRTLTNENIAMIALPALTTGDAPIQAIPGGAKPLSVAADLPRASSVAITLEQNGVFFTNPAERTIYYYMEGMNAPSTGLRAYGHTPMAVAVVQRGLRQTGEGEYSTVMKLPASGRLVLALASQSPPLKECLGVRVARNSAIADQGIALQWVSEAVLNGKTGDAVELRLRAKNSEEDALLNGSRLRLRIVAAQGGAAKVWPLASDPRHPGEWYARVALQKRGGYYAHLEADRPVDAVFATLLVE